MLLPEPAAPLLTPWQNFYVISGSSAGALTGLQFVVMALLAESRAGGMPEIRAFGSPTVVHFCAALLVSAIMSAPWPTLSGVETALAACGAAGVVYGITVVKHTRQQSGYKPDREDWFWYVALPLVAYAALLTAAILMASYRTLALFLIAAITLVLVFDGIHNAWDAVTFHVAARAQRRRDIPANTEVQK